MAKTFNGARCKLSVDGVIVGLFENVSYSINIGTEDVFILGRFSAAEITPTSYEVVTVNCSGFRLVGNGGHVLPKVPKLQDLLGLEYITLGLEDRQTNTSILTVTDVVPVSYSTGAQAKSNSRIQITYKGIRAADESGEQAESAGATDLP